MNQTATTMNSFRPYFLLILTLFCVGFSNAQTVYESLHVKDGKALQFTFPGNFYEFRGFDKRIGELFTTQEDQQYEKLDSLVNSKPLLSVFHFPAADRSITFLHEDLVNRFENNLKESTIWESPTISQINGTSVLLAGGKGTFDGKKLAAMYIGAISFGDYSILVTYGVMDGVKDYMNYEDFKLIFSNWKEVATDRENDPVLNRREEEIVEYDEEREPVHVLERSSFIEEILLEHYQNDLFETRCSPLNIFPDLGDNWMVPKEGNRHLLSEFVYKEDKGSVKIFSGGSIDNYSTLEDTTQAILLALDRTEPLELEFRFTFGGEQLEFNKYQVIGKGSISEVFTAVVENELIFFIADEGENPDEDFAYDMFEFVQSVWITPF